VQQNDAGFMAASNFADKMRRQCDAYFRFVSQLARESGRSNPSEVVHRHGELQCLALKRGKMMANMDVVLSVKLPTLLWFER
jgi:hypothetical protein